MNTKMRNLSLSIVLCFLTFSGTILAQNPILKGYADPHMAVWNGRIYASVGKDRSPDIKKFSIDNWAIYSSADLVNWRLESPIFGKDTYLGPDFADCWATDISTNKGKYYFYFSNHNYATGVLVADNPGGPYTDVLKKPLLPREMSVNHEYDPTVFTDDDGQKYIIFGRDGQLGDHLIHYQIARLNDDMVSLAEKPRDLLTDKPHGFGDKNRARDHQYFHKHNGIYYLSCAGAYMTSDNVYGPYKNERHSGQNGHSSFKEFNGQTYHMYEWTCEPFGNRAFRQVMMTYLHYKNNGDMVSDPDFLIDSNAASRGKYYESGVGNYDAGWEKIEAEWFFKKEGDLVKREGPGGGFEIQNIHNDDYLLFQYVRNMKTNTTINFRISSAHAAGGEIEIREDSENGTLLGSCTVPSTGNWENYQTISCKLNNTARPANTNLYIVFKGGKGELMRLDWFNFPNQKSKEQ